ncbi:MAG: site-specific integrase [Ruminococcus sp.]|nr:site-specific integrase [Ruminococcus sp.]
MPKRRSNIYKRKDGRYEGRIAIGYKEDGSRRYKFLYDHTLSGLKEKKALDVLNTDERKRLEQYLLRHLDRMNLGILLCLFTGLRIGELCELTWGDIDFSHGMLSVNRTVQRINKHGSSEVIIGSPKSQSSIRIVPIPAFLLELLAKQKETDEKYLLSSTLQPFETRLMQYRFKKILKDCNIRSVPFHMLRHTYATEWLVLENGAIGTA